MKRTLLPLLLLVSYLFGNSYLIPSTKHMAQDADLVIIGSIGSIDKTKERKLGSNELAEKQITIVIHATLKGKFKEDRIKVRHNYDGTNLEELQATRTRAIKEIEELELEYADKSESSKEFKESKKGRALKQRIDALQEQITPLLRHDFQPTPFDIPDNWEPSSNEEFLIFLKKTGSEYFLPYGNISIRTLSHLNKLPKHAFQM